MPQEKSSEYKRIYSLVYDWGIKNFRLLNLKTEEEEIKHFGKRIEDFTEEEKRGYYDGCYDIEYYFEIGIPYRTEQVIDCWKSKNDYDN